jgi:osmoprotectant transport system ATP-binding protein
MSTNQAVMLGNRRDRGAAVEFQHVSKRFGPGGSGSNAVVDLSLSVPPGEICVLVGPSGCGKTTSLKMVNRLVEPTSGKVLIDGRDISTVEPTELRRGIGYVIQQIGLFPHRTVAQNVATVPRLLGWPEARIRTRVDELLALVGLDSARMRDRYPSQLSGGERQRIGVARAMAAEPPVMLMDEPFGAVDPIVREHLQDEFLRIHGLLRMTVLFVTHDIDEAIKVGTRVAVLQEGGHLAQYAPPDELLLNPANEFVARFVGADRALKRLALTQVKEVSLELLTTVRLGERGEATSSTARGLGTVLVDGDERPLGWVPVDVAPGASGLGPNDVEPIRALVRIDASLRDALSVVLESPEQVGVVVDQMGRLLGAVTVDAISSTLRPPRETAASTLSRAGRETP